MFELTNEQRKCFALPPVESHWKRVEVKPSPYDLFYMYAYLDGQKVVKVIKVFDDAGQETYCEYGVNEMLSQDGTKLLPKTAKGKPQNFTTSNLEKRTPVGMALSYNRGYISVPNHTSSKSYYRSDYEGAEIRNFGDFEKWVEDWCKNTGAKELEDIERFAAEPRTHQKYKEGDFFRYRINRRLWGYGRILLDFAKMRKEGTEFWDIFFGKPLCVAVYHIATEDTGVTPEALRGRKMLPSQMIMDNIFYYGECEIIGNMPLEEEEKDYPIHYGSSISHGEYHIIKYQCGRTYISLEGAKEVCEGFRNGGIGWDLHVKLPVLEKCMADGTNMPYWNQPNFYSPREDLRNPKYSRELALVRAQMGIGGSKLWSNSFFRRGK